MKKPRVLIVEDESSIAELIAVNLRHNGFDLGKMDYVGSLPMREG